MKLDRRQIKTRKAILQASCQLLEDKNIEQITINEIAQEANINRGTFYLHFVDKYDMVTSFEDEMISYIHKIILENIPKDDFKQEFLPSRYDTIIAVLKCFERHDVLVTFLIQTNFNTSFRDKLQEKLLQTIDTKLSALYVELKNPIPMELGIKILTSLLLNIAEYAHESEETIDKEAIADTLFKSILQGPAKAMGLIK